MMDDEMLPQLDDVAPEAPALLDLAHLPQTDTYVAHLIKTSAGRDTLVRHALKHEWIDKLCHLFAMAEDLDMTSQLQHIHSVMKHIVMTNDQAVFETILRDDLVLHVCGIFEYDPDYPIQPYTYRNFLASQPQRFQLARILNLQKFTTTSNMGTLDLEKRIHQTFRAQYLKDVVLARIIEEAHFSVLTSIILYNQVEILNAISSNAALLRDLCDLLREASHSDQPDSKQRRLLALRFVQDFCTTAKNATLVKRHAFFRALASNAVLQEFPPLLAHGTPDERRVVADVVLGLVEHDVGLVRQFVMAQRKHKSRALTEVVLKRLVSLDSATGTRDEAPHIEQEEDDDGIKYQMVEIIKMLMDPTLSSSTSTSSSALSTSGPVDTRVENAEFFQCFFSDHLQLLLAPFAQLQHRLPPPPVKPIPHDRAGDMADSTTATTSMEREEEDDVQNVLILSQSEQTTYTLILDLLTFLIRTHTNRLKFHLLQPSTLHRITLLLHSPNNCIKCAVVRLFRTIVEQRDEFYNRFLVRSDLMKGIMRVWRRNGGKYNLLDSVVLEMLEFISKGHGATGGSSGSAAAAHVGGITSGGGQKSLIKYLVEKYMEGTIRRAEGYAPAVVQGLREAYDRLVVGASGNSGGSGLLSRSRSASELGSSFGIGQMHQQQQSFGHDDTNELDTAVQESAVAHMEEEAYFNEDEPDSSIHIATVKPTTSLTRLPSSEEDAPPVPIRSGVQQSVVEDEQDDEDLFMRRLQRKSLPSATSVSAAGLKRSFSAELEAGTDGQGGERGRDRDRNRTRRMSFGGLGLGKDKSAGTITIRSRSLVDYGRSEGGSSLSLSGAGSRAGVGAGKKYGLVDELDSAAYGPISNSPATIDGGAAKPKTVAASDRTRRHTISSLIVHREKDRRRTMSFKFDSGSAMGRLRPSSLMMDEFSSSPDTSKYVGGRSSGHRGGEGDGGSSGYGESVDVMSSPSASPLGPTGPVPTPPKIRNLTATTQKLLLSEHDSVTPASALEHRHDTDTSEISTQCDDQEGLELGSSPSRGFRSVSPPRPTMSGKTLPGVRKPPTNVFLQYTSPSTTPGVATGVVTTGTTGTSVDVAQSEEQKSKKMRMES